MKNLSKISLLSLLIIPTSVFAQTTAGSVLQVITNLVEQIIPILFAAALAFFVYGVIKYVIAGDADNKSEARSFLIKGIIGLFVITSVWGLVGVIQNTFNIHPTEALVPTTPIPLPPSLNY